MSTEQKSLEQEVIDIVVEQLGIDASEVNASKSFVEDLNADSLDLTELIMTFEERFGFEISEEDMKLRGFGDLLGFKQSGVKNFRLADPIQNEDLFLMAEKQIKKIELENINIDKYKALLKLYDQADIINDMV